MFAAAAATPVAASEEVGEGGQKYPRTEAETTLELKDLYTYRSQDPLRRVNDVEPKIELEADALISPVIRFHVKAVAESMLDPPPGKGARPERIGAFIEELWIEVGYEDRHVYAGKFLPLFGSAWDALDDLHGAAFAKEDYKFKEQIGAGAGYRWSTDGGGEHVIDGSVFFQDRTPLKHALFNDRETPSLRDGGPGNTGTPESFALALQGRLQPSALDYHLSVVRRAPGRGDEVAEKGVAASLSRVFEFGSFALRPFVEYVFLGGHDGVRGRTRSILTTAIDGSVNDWRYGLAYLRRETRASATDQRDTLVEISLGYQFTPDVFVDLGWARSIEGNEVAYRGELFLKFMHSF